MKTGYWVVGALVVIVGLFLTGKLTAKGTEPASAIVIVPVPTATVQYPIRLEAIREDGFENSTRSDVQGAIEILVTPLNFQAPGTELRFEVSLDTHSVDLNYDLAGLAVLKTDTGLILPASLWDAPQGGHHVAGTLSFALSVEQASRLQSANQITLEVRDLGVPLRSLVWEK